MNYSRQFINIVNRIFRCCSNTHYHGYYFNNNAERVVKLKVANNGEHVSVPCCVYNSFICNLIGDINEKKVNSTYTTLKDCCKDMKFEMTMNNSPLYRHYIKSMNDIKMADCDFNKFIKNNELFFYYMSGLMVDNNKKCIFMSTVDFDITEEGTTNYVFKLHINKSVFRDQKNSINKYIISKIVSYLSDNPVHLDYNTLKPNGRYRVYEREYITSFIEIEINNDIWFSKFIYAQPYNHKLDGVNDFLFNYLKDNTKSDYNEQES